MPITINGSGSLTGVSVGGLPDEIVDADMLAANAVSEAKLATSPQQGLAKAWVNYDGGSVSSPRDSFNVDSITSIASGKHQINFTNAMPNNDYAFFG